jgi:hypothetical protein
MPHDVALLVRRLGALHDDLEALARSGDDEAEKEHERRNGEYPAAFAAIAAARDDWPDDEAKVAALEAALRAGREWEALSRLPDDADYDGGGMVHENEYGPIEVFHESVEDLVELFGSRCAAQRWPRLRHRQRDRAEVDRELARCASQALALVRELGAEPWSATPSPLRQSMKLSGLGRQLRKTVPSIPEGHPHRLAARRAARALWVLDHPRIPEVHAVWSEARRAVLALARALGLPGA